jgi:hypothetical protein
VLLSDIRRSPGLKFALEFFQFEVDARFHSLNLQPGDEIAFEAQVTDKLKSYAGSQMEYEWELSNPTNLRLVSRKEPQK